MPVEEIKVNSAKDLLDHLNPTNERWKGIAEKRWAFRGQADARWRLVPKAFRKGIKLDYYNPDITGPIGDGNKQNLAEYSILMQFYNIADDIGLKLPGDNQRLRNSWAYFDNDITSYNAWPPGDSLDLLAIAQHHGVPTRLVDFTYNPLVAAYFASLIHDNQDDEHIEFAVWAIDLEFIEKKWPVKETKSKLRPITVPRSENRFLHRQDGLFIFDEKATFPHHNSDHDYSIDEAILSAKYILEHAPARINFDQPIHKITVPISEATETQLLLRIHKISKPQLMPSFDNVVSFLEQNNSSS